MKIAIIGTGLYSLGISSNLKYDELSFWTENQEIVKEYTKTKKLDSIIKGVKFGKNVSFSTDYQKVLENAKIVFLMTSSAYIEEVCKDIKKNINKNTIVVVGTKGILSNGLFISDITKKTLPTKKIVFISGPTFAENLLKSEPCALNIAGNENDAIKVSKIFNDNIYLKYTLDVNGVQLCGSIKNVFAIGSGIISGLKYHESTNAFYITKLIKEMQKILRKLDCFKETVYDFAGLGDTILTCSSSKSRNFELGKLLGSKKVKSIKKHVETNTCEGYYTLESINTLFNKKHINYPIINALYRIVYQNEKPEILIEILLIKDKVLNSKKK